MSARDAEKFDPAPSWLWDPARQQAIWANAPAAALFAACRGGAPTGPLPAADPIAALSNACHTILISTGCAEFGPTTVFGRRIRCRSALRPLDGGGAGILIEVTESARDDSADADDEDRHLARAAHDLRTPLTAIIGFAELISARGAAMPEGARRDYLSDIVDAGRFAARIAEDLLTFTTTGRPGPPGAAEARADLAAIAQATARLLAVEAERRGIELSVSVEVADMDAVVAAEPDQIRRAIGNLAGNALAHARRAVCVFVLAEAEGGLTIRVADDGPGLSPEDLRLALQPFGRPSAAAGSKGVGLGLPIARRFAEANGARLEIDTAPGRGFAASIRFPETRRNRGA